MTLNKVKSAPGFRTPMHVNNKYWDHALEEINKHRGDTRRVWFYHNLAGTMTGIASNTYGTVLRHKDNGGWVEYFDVSMFTSEEMLVRALVRSNVTI